MSKVRVDRIQGATFVELFFDLVFVYAVTQLTAFVLHDLTWSGVGHALVLFWLVWWSWTQFTWTLNDADTEHVLVRLPTLAATALAFFLAQSLPEAFGDAGLWFAGSYVLVRALGLVMQVAIPNQEGDQVRVTVLWVGMSSVGLLMILVGGLAGEEARLWWWAGAIIADFLAAAAAGRGEWVIQAGHFAERHGLIVIIALGESLIAAGIASSDMGRDAGFAVVTAGAVVGACALWWTYFATAQPRLEQAMDRTESHLIGAFARDVFSFAHAAIVVGVIGVAIGFEEAIAHPAEHFHDEVALAFVFGAVLFVGGTGVAAFRAGLRDLAVPRLVFSIAAIASLPVVRSVDAIVAVWLLALGAVVVGVVEHYRSPDEPLELYTAD